MRYRVSSSKAEEINAGATFAPGEEAPGFDPSNPEDARKLEEGLFVEIREAEVPEPSDAVLKKAEELSVDLGKVAGSGSHGRIVIADVEKAHENQEESN